MSNFENKSILDKFRIVIASLPDRENCVCEIYYDHFEWAEISREQQDIMIQIYPHPTMPY